MRYHIIVLAGVIAAAPAFAATLQPRERPGQATPVAAKRLTLDEIARLSRTSAPRRVIYAKRVLR